MKTAIMTDSNSGMLADEAKKQGIYLLPMPVIIEDQEYSEGIDITSGELYQAMEAGKNCRTSQPSPELLAEMWREILGEGYDEIVYIPMSSSLSGSCEQAMLKAQEGFESKVFVVDNQRISVTQMESALEAKHLADKKKSALEIKEYLEKTKANSSIYLAVDSLKYLKKSGRLNPTAAAVGSVLNIKPILSIQGGLLDPYAKVRGMKNCERKMIEALRSDLQTRFAGIPSARLRLQTAGTLKDPEAAERWRNTVEAAFPKHSVYYANLPCSIACHIGPECMGIGVTVINDWE